MTRMSLLLSLILAELLLFTVPSVAIEKLNCPFIFTNRTPSKLERNQGTSSRRQRDGQCQQAQLDHRYSTAGGYGKESDCKSSRRRLLPDGCSGRFAD